MAANLEEHKAQLRAQIAALTAQREEEAIARLRAETAQQQEELWKLRGETPRRSVTFGPLPTPGTSAPTTRQQSASKVTESLTQLVETNRELRRQNQRIDDFLKEAMEVGTTWRDLWMTQQDVIASAKRPRNSPGQHVGVFQDPKRQAQFYPEFRVYATRIHELPETQGPILYIVDWTREVTPTLVPVMQYLWDIVKLYAESTNRRAIIVVLSEGATIFPDDDRLGPIITLFFTRGRGGTPSVWRSDESRQGFERMAQFMMGGLTKRVA